MKIKLILNLFYFGLVVVLVGLGGLVAYSVLGDGKNGGVFVVQSGSMEPAIKTASVVFVLPRNNPIMVSPAEGPRYEIGEVISYGEGKEVFTHRVVDIKMEGGRYYYQTKGDANEAVDVGKVSDEMVVGRVVGVVPYLGYLFDFVRTQTGYVLLFVVPITIVVYSEILKIKNVLLAMIEGRKRSSVLT